MRINEILRISTQDFPIHNVKKILSMATDNIGYIDDYMINYIESGNERILILTDSNKEVAAFAGFIARMNGSVWQAKNLQVYGNHQGKKLSAKIYLYVKNTLKKSIQSDVEQSPGAEILWTKILPSMGIFPKIFDTVSEYIIDTSNKSAYNNAKLKMYTNDSSDSEKYRYTWVLEKNDYYTENSILKESSILLPQSGKWFRFYKEKYD